jgi:phosphohistidine phosphatase
MSENEARRLVVMRHAKTESMASSDHDRDLTDRGRRDARAAGAWLAKQRLAPAVVLVSSAVRARSTADEVCAALESRPDVRVLDELYQADEYEVIDLCVAEVPAEAGIVLVVGHNPTMTMAANLLQGDDDRQDLALPTAALAVLEVCGPWSELAPGAGVLGTVYRAGD